MVDLRVLCLKLVPSGFTVWMLHMEFWTIRCALILEKSGLIRAQGIFLVKPQFEDSKATEKGILRDDAHRETIVARLKSGAEELGFLVTDRFDLPQLTGKNHELFLMLTWVR
ncbi:MAG: hypothetical protein K8S54_07740 [Spirochaetia bacterium]|nr:hypothetical protein [Spirochaetia bacterium]